MPIYTYMCSLCENKFTKSSSIDSRDNQFCHECGTRLVRRPEVGLVWAPTSGKGLA